MKSAVATSIALGTSAALAYVQGFDVSDYQGTVDFTAAYNSGARFVIIKATEGTDIIDSEFNNHYEGATAAGFIRGGYHFAHPYQSDGATQADFFLAHGGGWTADGRTLPGMVDLESGESEGYPECWGLSQSEMIDWISSFSNQYQSSEGRPPMIYCSPSWWETCTGNTDDFTNNPLVEADWASSISTVPGGWPYESFWQYSDSYEYGGDADYWNGDLTNLKKFATG